MECYLAASEVACFYQLGNMAARHTDFIELLHYGSLSSNVCLLAIAALQRSGVLFLFLLSFKSGLFFYSNYLLANKPFLGLAVLGGL